MCLLVQAGELSNRLLLVARLNAGISLQVLPGLLYGVPLAYLVEVEERRQGAEDDSEVLHQTFDFHSLVAGRAATTVPTGVLEAGPTAATTVQ